MIERKRMFLLILIMITVCMIVIVITINILYRTAFEAQRERLVETAQSQARLIEAVARFDAAHEMVDPGAYLKGPAEATLNQIKDAHKHYKGFGKTGEFTLARRVGDNIVFLLSHRHHDLENQKPIPFDSELAEPIRRAVSGQSGTVIGLDYRGKTVLAAHEPVAVLNLGIVAKIDLAEIRAPFVKSVVIAGSIMVLVVFGGTVLFIWISTPVIRRLEEHAVELTTANEQLAREIEERKRMEEALQESKKELTIRNRIAQIFLTVSDDEMYAEVLQVVLETMESRYGTFGYINEDGDFVCPSMTRDIWDQCLVPDKDIVFPREKWGGIWGRALIEKKTLYSNGPFSVPQGHIPIIRAMAMPIIHKGEVIGLMHLANKETDYDEKDKELLETIADHISPVLHARLQKDRQERKRKRAEEDLRIKDNAIESTINAIAFVDIEGNLTYVNPSFLKLWGYANDKEILGKPAVSFWQSEENASNVLEILSDRGIWTGELVARKKDDQLLNIFLSANMVLNEESNPVGMMASFIDTTKQKLLQDQLIRSERLAATGQLAASIAHEINSPLQSITIMLSMLKTKYKENDELSQIDTLKDAFSSIRDTVKNLIDLNRPGKEAKQSTNINNIIEKTFDLVQSLLKKNRIKVNLNLSSRVPNITASPQQFNQVFLNLINNTIEAMAGTSKNNNGWMSREFIGGEINMTTIFNNGSIVIQFADTGPGISDEDLDHIFDPFYTRKKRMGMGVGLSICHGIIEDHNGTIEAKNLPEGGAVFTITIPEGF